MVVTNRLPFMSENNGLSWFFKNILQSKKFCFWKKNIYFAIFSRLLLLPRYRFHYEVRKIDSSSSVSLLRLALQFSWFNIAIQLVRHGFAINRYNFYDSLLDMCHTGLDLADPTYRVFLRCMAAGGYRPLTLDLIAFDRNWPFQVLSEQQLDKMADLYPYWVQIHNMSALPTLKQICRENIRRCIRKCRQKSVIPVIQKLQFPTSLIDYLCLSEFKSFSAVPASWEHPLLNWCPSFINSRA